MPFQPVPQTIGIEVRGTVRGIPVENTFYAQYVIEPDQDELDEFSTALVEGWQELALPVMSVDYTLREVYVRLLNAEIALQSTALCEASCAGEIAGASLPNLNSIAIARRSGFTGRSARGRIFWPVLAASQVSGNFITSSMRSAVIVVVEGIDTVITTSGYVPVIVSRYHNNLTRAEGVTLPIAQWVVVDDKVDSRKGRMN